MQDTVLTLGEKTSMGLMTTGLGLLVVFAALTLIIVVTMILSHFVMDKPNIQQNSANTKNTQITEPVVTAKKAPEEDVNLIAVLSAAVAAYIGQAAEGKLVVRSFRKIISENSWSAAGRSSQINSKF